MVKYTGGVILLSDNRNTALERHGERLSTPEALRGRPLAGRWQGTRRTHSSMAVTGHTKNQLPMRTGYHFSSTTVRIASEAIEMHVAVKRVELKLAF